MENLDDTELIGVEVLEFIDEKTVKITTETRIIIIDITERDNPKIKEVKKISV